MEEIDFKKIEEKWQNKWEQEKIFEADESSNKPKHYVLEMFAYPSAEGLHMGHSFNFVIGDIFARFKKMNGFSVLHPTGFDSLGLPAENSAIKNKKHPQEYTNNSIKNFTNQQRRLGLTYDWSRMLNTADPSYYKWDQWIFLKMFERGLAYQKTSAVNWCPSCQTVLANEQAQNGKCDRCDSRVEIKHLKQWFLKITNYADELHEGIDKLNWPEKTKAMQKNWIGKSYGTEIDFEVEKPKEKKKQNVIIVHGWGGNAKGNWFPWFKENNKEDFNILIPTMPNPERPNLKEWLSEIEKLKVQINEDTILIGHSLGCPTLCKFLESNKIKVKKLILVAPSPTKFNEEDFEIIKRLNSPKEAEDSLRKYLEDLNIDFKEVKKYSKENVLYLSKDDPYVANFNYRINEYHDLNAKLNIYENKGHFNSETGITEFPELLDEIINCEKWPIFTTRPDTIFGVTFMVVSAHHKDLMKLVTTEQEKEVQEFLKKIGSVSQKSMKEIENLDKEGVFTGSFAINPANNEKIPIYAGNFVVADYGSGMVMAVPAHDSRDFEFAKKYGIEIKQVICAKDPLDFTKKYTGEKAFTEEGVLMNSKQFSGQNSEEAKKEITDWLIAEDKARSVVNFRLRDWGISRQRYWGTPIPIIHCETCGAVAVKESDLPVTLPKEVKFGTGNPLETSTDWTEVKCPKCNGDAKRETDTMDTFVNSSWYFLRYCDPKNDKKIFDEEKVKHWCPVDTYIGGAEHACMHLIYSRFYVKFLRDLGLLNFDEPANRLFHQGMINDDNGEKMSKSKGNVVEPIQTIEKYGTDTTRFFLVSVASPDKGFNWTDDGINGSLRFIKRVINFFENYNEEKDNPEVISKLNQTIKEVSENIECIEYRKATIKIRELFDLIEKEGSSKETLEKFLKILNPFCPHITEELWEKLGKKEFLSTSPWPIIEESKIIKKGETKDLTEKIISELAPVVEKFPEKKNIYIYAMPFEIEKINAEKIIKETKKEVKILKVNDAEKFDPENKAKKAKPGKPSFYME